MIHRIYAVYDNAVKAYLPPFFVPSEGAAVRAFVHACMDPEHQFNKSLHDYTLFYLGTFDDTEAAFHTADSLPPRTVISGRAASTYYNDRGDKPFDVAEFMAKKAKEDAA